MGGWRSNTSNASKFLLSGCDEHKRDNEGQKVRVQFLAWGVLSRRFEDGVLGPETCAVVRDATGKVGLVILPSLTIEDEVTDGRA